MLLLLLLSTTTTTISASHDDHHDYHCHDRYKYNSSSWNKHSYCSNNNHINNNQCKYRRLWLQDKQQHRHSVLLVAILLLLLLFVYNNIFVIDEQFVHVIEYVEAITPISKYYTIAQEIRNQFDPNGIYYKYYNCEEMNDISNAHITDTTTINVPKYVHVPPSYTIEESKYYQYYREYSLLYYYAYIQPYPTNSSMDDYVIRNNNNNNVDDEVVPYPTNPYFNSRQDVAQITNKYIARILLGCTNHTILDNLLLKQVQQQPFAVVGTSANTILCHKDGDYDFATLDMIQLLYISQQYNHSLSPIVYNTILYNMLSHINGTIDGTLSITLPCFLNGRYIITLANDTENHILQTQITRYLINQLLVLHNSNNENDDDQQAVLLDPMIYNNTMNGNTQFLIQYLSHIGQDYFYEYNSRPYQLFTIKAIQLLYSYSIDIELRLLCEKILHIISYYSSIQMNMLRRIVPFRRQPKYNTEYERIYEGDAEVIRMSVLVGNYQYFDTTITTTTSGGSSSNGIGTTTSSNTEYIIPGSITGLTLNCIINTIASSYRIPDFILRNFFRATTSTTTTTTSSVRSSNTDTSTIPVLEDEYYISNHYVVEMYYSTSQYLLSSGGHLVNSHVPLLSIRKNNKNDDVKDERQRNFCLVGVDCLFDGSIKRRILNEFYVEYTNGERGWSRPTTILPTNQKTWNIYELIRFNGHRYISSVARQRHLCVGPNFVCGLQFTYGTILEPLIQDCSIVDPKYKAWRFMNLYNNENTKCPQYGFYLAVYIQSCDTNQCSDIADNYGFLEIYSPNNPNNNKNNNNGSFISFTEFYTSVIKRSTNNNNSIVYKSNQIYTYTLLDNITKITFEIQPSSISLSQIIQIELPIPLLLSDSENTNNASNGNTTLKTQILQLDRYYRNWPKMYSSAGSIQSLSSIGRWTFDLLYDDDSQKDNNSEFLNTSSPSDYNSTIDDKVHLQRYIYDFTDTSEPRYIETTVPKLNKIPIPLAPSLSSASLRSRSSSSITISSSRFFDDSASIVANDYIESITFYCNIMDGTIIGFNMKWGKSGLSSQHGNVGQSSSLSSLSIIQRLRFGVQTQQITFESNEYITTVGTSTIIAATTTRKGIFWSWFGRRQQHRSTVNRIRIVTNVHRTIIVGNGQTEDAIYTTITNETTTTQAQKIIAFYGQESDDMIHQLGVVAVMI